MASGHTPRSMKLMRDDGYLVEVVERWVPAPGRPGGGVRKDFLGFADLIGISEDGTTLAVQVTSEGQFSAHVRKLTDLRTPDGVSPLRRVLKAGWRIEVHGWAKVRNRWELVKRKEFVLGDGGGIARTGDDG